MIVMKKFLFSLSLLAPLFVLSQTEADIRKHYTDVNKQIAESIDHGYEGSLYNNHWVTNKNGKSWPAVGIYSETTDFWYDDPPDHLSASDRNPKTVLLKVTKTTSIGADVKSNEEYLYKNGKLLFYYNHWGEENNLWETRVYFNNKGIMFKSSVKANGKELTAKDFLTEEYKDFKPNSITIMANGKKCQDLFVKSM
jgi:hypothetical protein